ncbi:hypothetical protein B0H19DRAFT_1061133 [Mycena capillaripes]|nr:hypothetical protein B0H19DRAFT_1061133 [Mycena capillaripes]
MAHGPSPQSLSRLAVLRELRRKGIHVPVRQYQNNDKGLGYVVARVLKTVQEDFEAGNIDRPAYEAQLQVKFGHTKDFGARKRAYKKCYPLYHHIWYSTYACSQRMLLERAVHLSLRHKGALTRGVRCNCKKLHREFYDFNAVGGYAGMEAVVEKWLRIMGEKIDRTPFAGPIGIIIRQACFTNTQLHTPTYVECPTAAIPENHSVLGEHNLSIEIGTSPEFHSTTLLCSTFSLR